MGYTVNSIVINEDIKKVFTIINDINNWPALHGYKKAELKRRERLCDGNERIVFEIFAEDNGEEEHWASQRIINHENYSARGVRLNPMFPFKYWILDVILTPVNDGTEMKWVQDFSMDPKTGHTDEEIEGYINHGSKKELLVFKNFIENRK